MPKRKKKSDTAWIVQTRYRLWQQAPWRVIAIYYVRKTHRIGGMLPTTLGRALSILTRRRQDILARLTHYDYRLYNRITREVIPQEALFAGEEQSSHT